MAIKFTNNQLLDEDFLRKLERFKLLAKKGLKGPAAGEHLSWRSGVSPDFLDHRKYQWGDDFRNIDWNVYGRLDKIFIKLFRAEEDLTIHILLDISRSMSFGKPSKDLHAKKIAAALAYLGLANQDRVGISAFNRELVNPSIPQKGKTVFISLIDYLLGLDCDGETDLTQALSQYVSSGNTSGMVVIISDFFDSQGLEKALDVLNRGRFDVTLVQVLDGEELAPTLDGFITIKDMETGETKKMTVDRQMMILQRRVMEGFLEGILTACQQRGMDYCFFDTRRPVQDFLFDFLTGQAGIQRDAY
jgi:uncharacterized protein (DUF58 family)